MIPILSLKLNTCVTNTVQVLKNSLYNVYPLFDENEYKIEWVKQMFKEIC